MTQRRLSRIPFGLIAVLLAGALLCAAYIFGLSWWQSRGNTLFLPEDLHIPRTVDVVIYSWLLWMGASIGSFLNVVAWRMPRGESISGRSHCPRCMTSLGVRDNIPVLGWLALQGRCRTCRLPISPRYPIVEAFVGLSLSVLGIFELYRLCLPYQLLHWHGGPLWAPRVDRPLIMTLIYHSVAVSVAWAYGLIRWDGNRLPKRLVLFGFAALIIPMLAAPSWMMIVSWQSPRPVIGTLPDYSLLSAIMRVLTALVAATLIGRSLVGGLCPAADPKLNPLGGDTVKLIDLVTILSVPAIVVGWQALPAVVLIASVLAVIIRSWIPRTVDALGRFAIAMPIALTFAMVFWRLTFQISWWPSEISSPLVIMLSAGFVLCIPLWLSDQGVEGSESVPTDSDSVDADGMSQDDESSDKDSLNDESLDEESESDPLLD